jgi:hypothetical protein
MKLLSVICLLFANFSIAQCLLQEVPFSQKVNNSTCIVEGRILQSEGFWNDNNDFIFTRHRIEIYKVFKGNPGQLHIVTEGGVVGDRMIKAVPSTELQPGDVGMFFLYPLEKKINGIDNAFVAYSGPQGFFRYDEYSASAMAPFQGFSNIEEGLYPEIMSHTGRAPEIRKEYVINQIKGEHKSSVAINSFTPSALSAGIGAILTINGSGFGSSHGTNSFVEFRNSNTGGSGFAKPLASEYISWSNSQIRVKVPSLAGTGTFRVVVNGVTANSPSALQVEYSHLNAVTNDNAYETALISKSNGGYDWRMSAGFDGNTAAKDAFRRALQAWRCGTYVNWQLGNATSINATAHDGINIVRFDIGSELQAGVLGVCYSYWSGCFLGTTYAWFVDELDIVFDDGANWNYGPSAPSATQVDFESVVLHELGHGHQLGHVINSNEIMHFSMGAGQVKRVLSASDLNGGNYVVGKSTSNNTCLKGSMTALNGSSCSLSSIPVASVNIAISSGSNPSCEGGFTTFTANVANGGNSPNFQWRLNGNNVGTNSNSFSSSTIQDGDAIICEMTSTLSGVQGSPATSNTIAMQVAAKPVSAEILPVGSDSITCSIFGISYEWKFNNTTTVGTTKTIRPTLIGNYSVMYTASNNCPSDYSAPFFYNPVGISGEAARNAVKVFPNPGAGQLTIQWHLSADEPVEISVLSLIGKQVYHEVLHNVGQEVKIDLSNLGEGIYFLQLSNGYANYVEKVLIR